MSNKLVFLNVPFDEEYKDKFDAIVFTCLISGYTPKCSLEIDNSASNRLQKISKLIKDSANGIHDISRTELNDIGLPRFNMPFELGLFIGDIFFGNKKKNCLIFDKEKFRYQKYLSDIAGQDIHSHADNIKTLVKETRDWLDHLDNNKLLPGGENIFRRYQSFLKDLPNIKKELEIDITERLTYKNLVQIITNWIELNRKK